MHVKRHLQRTLTCYAYVWFSLVTELDFLVFWYLFAPRLSRIYAKVLYSPIHVRIICFQSHHANYSVEVFIILGFDGCNMLLAISIACEFSQQIRNAFSEINDLIKQFHWYRFPADMKRILPMTMTITQEPVSIEFFGSFSCCRELFRKVRREIEPSSVHCLIRSISFISAFEERILVFYGTS